MAGRAVCRAVLGVVAGLALWSLVPLAIGWHSTAVVSGSMSPRVERGDVVAASPIAGDAVAAGQVVLFTDPGPRDRRLLHRVLSVNSDGTLVTKGDANHDPDATPVPPEDVLGLARLRVPWAGLPVTWLGEGRWLPLSATAGALALIAAGAFGPGPRTRRQAVTAGTALLALVALGVTTSGAGFTAVTAATASWRTAPPSGYPAAVLADDPLYYYRLEETAGPTARDASGNGYDAGFRGSPQYGMAGALPSTPDAKATGFPSNTGLGFATTTTRPAPSQFTWEAFLRADYTSSESTLFQFVSDGGAAHYRVMLRGGEISLLQNASTDPLTLGSGYLTNGTSWQHVAIVVSQSTAQVFVNGKASPATALRKPGLVVPASRVSFAGPEGAPADKPYKGTLDEVAIYPRALPADRVQAHYDAR
ncbi:signal peptidase I [Saccharothrix australiensis]|uniref:Signal peptidase I n=1 Tax=Saccharothrix australiensis TaxID=2072 RepID=A0A495VZ62_9PSEU|nr:signal peptidase I [Saccharothrix australiensis]RKT54731.1 signal peptidase [Saccharothrix australiensis]